MDVLTVFIVPLVIFLLFVAPLWLLLHYRGRRGRGGLSRDESEALEQLQSQAIRMQERLESLEAILDAEAPGWRRRESASARRHDGGQRQ